MGKGSNTTTTMNIPNPEAMAAYREAIGRADTVSQTPWVGYDGNLVAGLNSTQQGGIQGANDSTTGWQPYVGAATGALGQVNPNINPEQFSADAVNKYMSPYMDQVVNSTMANLNRSNQISQQGLKSGAIQSGAFGGDRAGIASANMSREQGLATGQTLGNLLQSGYGQALGEFNNQQQTNLSADQANAARWMQLSQQIAGLGAQTQQQQIAGSNQQLAAGQVQQQTEQAQNDAAYNQFMLQRAYPFQTAGWYANIAQGIGSQMGGTTISQGPQPNAAGSIAGGIGSIASIASMFSDERLKENIEPIGKSFDGQNIYKYNYKGDPTTQIGLIAQEVEQRHPEAVNDDMGYKRVSYDHALGEAAHLGQERKYASGGRATGSAISGMPYGGAMGWVPEGPLKSMGASFPGAKQAGEQKAPDISGQLKAGMQSGKELGTAAKALGSKIGLFGGSPVDLQGSQNVTSLGDTMAANPDMSGATWGFADGGGVLGGDTGVPGGPLSPASGMQWPEDKKPGFKPSTAVALGILPALLGMASGGAVAGYSPSDADLDVAARTMLGEGRGEPEDGQRAILHVIANRRKSGKWGDDVDSVVKSPAQFSAWNKNDPNRPYMENLASDDPSLLKAKGLAAKVLTGQDEDPTGGARNYYNPHIVSPAWAKGKDSSDIGNHRFLTADGGPSARPMAYAEGETPRTLPSRSAPPAPVARTLGHNDNEPQSKGNFLSRLVGEDAPKSENGEKKSILEQLTGIRLSPEGQQGLLAASLGMMGNSSPFWNVQLGQGAMEGIKAYNEAKKVNAGVENTQASSRSTSMDAVQKSLQQTPGGNFVWLADGSMIPLDQYIKKPQPVLGFVPSQSSVERSNARAGNPPPPAPLPARPAVVESGRRADTPAPPVAPAAPDARPLAPGATPPPPAPGMADTHSVNGTPGAPYAYTPEMSEQTKKEIAEEKAKNISGPAVNLAMATENSQKMRNEVNSDYSTAMALRSNLNDLARSVMKLPREGSMLVAGTKFDTRSEIGKLVNTLVRSAGRPDLQIDPQAVAQGDIQSKLTNLMGQLGAAAGHQTAYEALQVISKNVPSGNMSPEAAAKLLSELYANQQRSIDRHKYVNQYVKEMGNGPAQFALSSFERDHPMAQYDKEKKVIEKIMLTRGKDKDGKDRHMVDDVYNYDPRVVDEKTKSPWISRYFVGG